MSLTTVRPRYRMTFEGPKLIGVDFIEEPEEDYHLPFFRTGLADSSRTLAEIQPLPTPQSLSTAPISSGPQHAASTNTGPGGAAAEPDGETR